MPQVNAKDSENRRDMYVFVEALVIAQEIPFHSIQRLNKRQNRQFVKCISQLLEIQLVSEEVLKNDHGMLPGVLNYGNNNSETK